MRVYSVKVVGSGVELEVLARAFHSSVVSRMRVMDRGKLRGLGSGRQGWVRVGFRALALHLISEVRSVR